MNISLAKIKIVAAQVITISTIVVLLIIVVEIIGIEMFKGLITEKTQAIQGVNQEVQNKTQVLEEHFLLRREAIEAEQIADNLKALLASRDDLLQLGKEFGRLAESAQVNVSTSFTSETQVISDLLGQIAITMSVSGEMDDIIRFLELTENSRFLIKLNSFDITTDGGSLRFLGRGYVIFRNE